MIIKVPIYETHDVARCFNCGGNVDYIYSRRQSVYRTRSMDTRRRIAASTSPALLACLR